MIQKGLVPVEPGGEGAAFQGELHLRRRAVVGGEGRLGEHYRAGFLAAHNLLDGGEEPLLVEKAPGNAHGQPQKEDGDPPGSPSVEEDRAQQRGAGQRQHQPILRQVYIPCRRSGKAPGKQAELAHGTSSSVVIFPVGVDL